MSDIEEPRVLEEAKTKRKPRLKMSDLLIVGVVALAIMGVVMITLSNLGTKRDVSNAEIVTDKVIAAIAVHDGAGARKLGTAKFQSAYTSAALIQQFGALDLVTVGTPTVYSATRSVGAKGKTVFVIYAYPPHLANQPFYVGITAVQSGNNPWQLTHISGSADVSKVTY